MGKRAGELGVSGLFVTLEGGEGAGKSTQCRLLAEALSALGHRVVRTREPGGSPGAEALRGFLLGQDHGLSLRAEVMVHFASRLDHLEKTIRPALDRGEIVVCDRFVDSTLAYQGYGLAQGDAGILAFIDAMIGQLAPMPDLTLLLDLPRAEAAARMDRRGGTLDRYERLDDAFHQRVADGFREIARQGAPRIVRIDAAADPASVHAAILQEVLPRLSR